MCKFPFQADLLISGDVVFVGQASSLRLNLTIIFRYDISFRSPLMDGLIRRRRLPHLDVDEIVWIGNGVRQWSASGTDCSWVIR